MRFQTLAFVACWVFLGVQAEADDTNGFIVTFESSRLSIGNNTPPAPQALYTIRQADSETTSLYLIQFQFNNGIQDPLPRAGKILDYCIIDSTEDDKTPCGERSRITIGEQQSIYFDLTPALPNLPPNDLTTYSYLLCFTNKDGLCTLPSSATSYPTGTSNQLAINRLNQPLGELLMQDPLPITLGSINAPLESSSTSNPFEASKTVFEATVTRTPDASATNPPPIPVGTGSKGGLSIGAKVGIAVGAGVLVLAILILALIFLRKKHRQRSGKERLMTNQSLNADSRDLITEKDITPTSYQIPNLNFHSPGSPTNETRHLSVLSPYDTVSQPYNGPAASIPRRRDTLPTSSAGAVGTTAIPSEPVVVAPSPISREVSSASAQHAPTRTIGTVEPASPTSNYEEYHDVPQYNHGSPQVFQGGLQEPFLSETDSDRGGSPAMTDADHARLAEEEEERRIDAAIAESERLKNQQGR